MLGCGEVLKEVKGGVGGVRKSGKVYWGVRGDVGYVEGSELGYGGNVGECMG